MQPNCVKIHTIQSFRGCGIVESGKKFRKQQQLKCRVIKLALATWVNHENSSSADDCELTAKLIQTPSNEPHSTVASNPSEESCSLSSSLNKLTICHLPGVKWRVAKVHIQWQTCVQEKILFFQAFSRPNKGDIHHCMHSESMLF